ncbi:hypothetical protein AALA73_08520, partial [Parasutterella excrementihominis]|uniref:hypothetical protein n=1 Tax=Parasutterella excrementihominis TaxID=487175 RepID=UPI003516D09A
AEKIRLYTKQKLLQGSTQKQIKALSSALFVKEKIFFETSLEDHICQLRDQKSTKSDGCTKLK